MNNNNWSFNNQLMRWADLKNSIKKTNLNRLITILQKYSINWVNRENFKFL